MKYTKYIGPATYQGKLYNAGAYPGVVPSLSSSDLVQGEVYKLLMPRLTLQTLDRYEECGADFPEPAEYIRTLQPIRMKDGRILSAWLYLYNRPVEKLHRLLSGDFLKRQMLKKT